MPHPNLELLETAAARLRPLLSEIVFVGGCATDLLITDPAAAPVRITYDVDVIAEIASYAGRGSLLEEIDMASSELRHFIGEAIRSLLAEPRFLDALPGYLLPDAANQRRIMQLREKLDALSRVV